jgi:microcin C transport system substrate-binding protein
MYVALRPLVLVGMLAACNGADSSIEPQPAPGPQPAAPPENVDVQIPKATYLVDSAAGDANVSAELGGPGFTGEGWSTRMETFQLGNPEAPQGGQMAMSIPDWPATLRQAGQNWNTSLNYLVGPLLYMSLLDLDPVTLEFVPALATHWQISEDKQTYRFRINPAARWSDGREVTADDVVATHKLKTDETMLDPSSVITYGKLHPPKAVSKYIVEVSVKEESWRNFLYFSGMSVFPAHEIGQLKGKDYLDKYQFAYTAVTGPYEVNPDDIDMGNALTVTRRKDWWGEANPVWDGWYNIEKFKFVVVKDPQLGFEKMKKGELDYMIVPKAQWWAEDIPALETVRRGLLVPRKFYTEAPIGTSGLALNMQRAPLDDIRIRKALQHLYDRETMIEKLFFNEYEPLTSYFQGEVYRNPNNELIPYDELTAVKLLEEAGWTQLNDKGIRVKDGKELVFTVSYSTQLSERSLTLFQESCTRAGIRIDLQLLSPATAWKNFQDKEYQIHDAGWGGLIFPNPESSWHSRLATEKANNNTTAFADPKVDALLAQYDHEYDVNKRIELIRQVDGILYEQAPYVLGWYNPAQRVLFWNKFGMPEWGSLRYGEQDQDLFYLWWVDPDLEKQLEAARTDANLKMDGGRKEIRFWKEWAKKNSAPNTSPDQTSPDQDKTPEGAGR